MKSDRQSRLGALRRKMKLTRQDIIDDIVKLGRMQTGRYVYWSHLKRGYCLWFLSAFVGFLLMAFVSRFCALLSVPCVLAWDYLILFDVKRRIFVDDYRLETYEKIGTASTSLLICVLVVGMVFGIDSMGS